MPKTVPKFKEPLIFGYYIHARPELGEIKWQWSDQRKQFWEDWIPKDKDLIIHTTIRGPRTSCSGMLFLLARHGR